MVTSFKAVVANIFLFFLHTSADRVIRLFTRNLPWNNLLRKLIKLISFLTEARKPIRPKFKPTIRALSFWYFLVASNIVPSPPRAITASGFAAENLIFGHLSLSHLFIFFSQKTARPLSG